MLIHMDEYVYRFTWQMQAYLYAVENCRGKHEYYIIVDTEKNEVVDRWNY